MTGKMARWIFYLGTLVSLALFLVLTVDTYVFRRLCPSQSHVLLLCHAEAQGDDRVR